MKYAIYTSRRSYIRLKYFALEPRTSIFSLSDRRTRETHIFLPITAATYLSSWNFKAVIGWKMYKRSKFCLTKLGKASQDFFHTLLAYHLWIYMCKTKNARLGIHILDNIWWDIMLYMQYIKWNELISMNHKIYWTYVTLL